MRYTNTFNAPENASTTTPVFKCDGKTLEMVFPINTNEGRSPEC